MSEKEKISDLVDLLTPEQRQQLIQLLSKAGEEDLLLDISDEERFEIVTKRILKQYLPAFQELAK